MQEFLNYTIYNIKVVDIIIAIGILFIAYFLKVQLAKIVLKNLKFLTSKTKTSLDDKLIHIIEPPLQLAILIIGFYLAERWIDIDGFKSIAKSLEKTFITFTIFWVLYRCVNEFSYICRADFKAPFPENGINFLCCFIKNRRIMGTS